MAVDKKEVQKLLFLFLSGCVTLNCALILIRDAEGFVGGIIAGAYLQGVCMIKVVIKVSLCGVFVGSPRD